MLSVQFLPFCISQYLGNCLFGKIRISCHNKYTLMVLVDSLLSHNFTEHTHNRVAK